MALFTVALAALLGHVVVGDLTSQSCTFNRQATIQADAEATIGGIIRMRDPGASGSGCGLPSGSMQSYEALRWALDLVNKKDEYLNGQFLTDYYVPGIRLGMRVVDYCGHNDAAVAAVTTLFPSLSSDSRSCTDATTNITLGIIGTTNSGSTADVNAFTENFDIPVVSYSSTAPSLTYSALYPNFLRTIPPDSELVQVMANVLVELNWTFVVVVYEDAAYGRSAYEALRPALAAAGICLTTAIKVDPADTTADTVQSTIRQAMGTEAVGVISLVDTPMAQAILTQGKNVQDAGKLQWMFTDTLPLDSSFTSEYARGIISIVPDSRYIVEFEDHWVRIDEENSSPENPWYGEWFMQKYNCRLGSVTGTQQLCSTIRKTEREKRQNFVQDQYVEPAVHSVFAYASALRQAQSAKCGAGFKGICAALKDMTHTDFLENYLKKVEFTYAARERVPSLASDQYAPYFAAKKLQFDMRGDIISPSFSVWNYNDVRVGLGTTDYKFRNVGNYLDGRLLLTKQNMRMYTVDRRQPLSPLPPSRCPTSSCFPCLGVPQDMKYMYVDGDIVINGIFSLHEMGPSKFTCGKLASNMHPHYLEAMFYAIQRANTNGMLKTGVRLGGLGIDDCMDADLSTTFINLVQRGMYTVKDVTGKELDPRKVEAYSGAYNSQLTIPLAQLMDSYRQPLVGYRATSAKLDMYKYYLKVVPDMADELRAIVLILKQYNWNHVQVVYSTDAYDEDDVTLFHRLAAEAGICVVATYDIGQEGDAVVNMLAYNSKVQPVVLLLSPTHHKHFVRVLSTKGAPGDFNYIATATLGNQPKILQGYEAVAEGFITIDLAQSTLDQFYSNLGTRRVTNYSPINPWFTEWYEALHNCSVDSDLGMYPAMCLNVTSRGVTDATAFEREYRAAHVINAVYATAKGLDQMLMRYCGANYNSVCSAFASANQATRGGELLNEILKVVFTIEDTSPAQTFRFQGRRGRLPYIVYNFQSGLFSSVGSVDPFARTISITGTVRLYGGQMPATVMPTCAQPCTECLYMFAFQQYWYLDGDLIIPAVFDIHFKGVSAYTCGALRETNGVQYTEAFKFMLDFINSGNASGISLNNVRLGGIAFDGCSSVTRSSAIINGVMGRTFPIMDNNNMMVDPSRFVSWLTYDSESTMEAASLLKMIGMPIVTPAATAPQLLDKSRYSTFFRTVPSDSVIARAMADLMKEMGWRYVITLNAPEEGSRAARDLFRTYMQKMGMCVVAAYEFETDGAIDVILRSISGTTSDVVAVFSEPDMYIPDMLRTKATMTDPIGDIASITFVSNRFWDLNRIRGLTQASSNVAYNTLSFRMRNTRVPRFLDYLKTQTLAGSSNPWLPEYYQALFQCDLAGSRRYNTPCDTMRTLGASAASGQDMYQDIHTLTTINAVHALAVAVDQTLDMKCGASYSGVCTQFLRDQDTLEILMQTMDNQTFTDLAGQFFDFVNREVSREYDVMRHMEQGIAAEVGTLSGQGVLQVTIDRNPNTGPYRNVKAVCPADCLVCEGFDANFRNFSYTDGDVYIVGLFDVHKKGATPFSCGSINDRQGLQLLEAFNFAIDYMNKRSGDLFSGKFRGVRIGGIGIDVCNSPTRAANLVANIQSGTIVLNLGGGFTISPNQILAYVGPFDTPTTIRVADILSAIGVPQITYGATGLQLQDAVKYDYFLRSVPADDKQARAIISYLKYFNLTNVQVVTTSESVGLQMTKEFKRLAILNLVCITHNYTVGETGVITAAQAEMVVQKLLQNNKAKVVILLMHDPFSILQAAGRSARAQDEILWVATDKWGFDPEYLDGRLDSLLGDRRNRDNVIIFDVETADVPLYDQYLQDKTPDNYKVDPWFQEYYEFLFGCSWNGGTCDATRGIPRANNYVQDPFVLYVVNAVFSCGLGIHKSLKVICDDATTTGYDGLCLKFQATGYRRDIVMQGMRESNFTDDTRQPFYYEPTGESGRGYHIYNVTANTGVGSSKYMYENVGSYNDTHFLKLDITYDIVYQAQCTPFVDCTCDFPRDIPSRYMAQPSPFQLNLVYIGDIHQPHPTNPFACSSINIGTDFFKMMAFFYAINRVNINKDRRYPDSLRLGGVALDTCSSTLRLDQDVFNLLSGFPLCDTADTIQVISPSSIVAFLPDSNSNAIPVSRILATTGITSLSPSATSAELRNFYMSDNFLSVVPPDNLQAGVILKMMSQLRWDYGSVIYSEETNMIAAKNELLSQAEAGRAACFGQAIRLPLNADLDQAKDVLQKVSQQVGARAVVLFTLPAHTRLLLQAAREKGMTGRFIWIGTTAWGDNDNALKNLEQEASGAIVLQPRSVEVEEFRAFIKSLTFTNRRGIPNDWFEEIYQTMHKCTIRESKRPLSFSTLCSKTERITDAMVPYDTSVLHTIIAVYMVAQGLNSIPSCRLSSFDIAACLTNLKKNRNQEIYQAVLGSQFNVLPDLLGQDSFTFSFDKSGYGNIGFDILNYHSDPNGAGFIYTRLGTYTDSLTLSTRGYAGLGLFDAGVVPNSNCVGVECKCAGSTTANSQTGVVVKEWSYAPSLASVEVTEEGRTYQDPATGKLYYVETIPNVGTRFTDMWGVAVATLAAIGVFVSLALFIYLLVVYPVRGGTSVLGYVLAFGIILLYGLVFAFVAHVNQELCGLRRFCLGFCYAICYSTLFVKLVDCWRSRAKEDMFEVKYNKLGRPFGLFMVCVLLVLVQVIINAEWLILVPPRVVRIFYNNQYFPRCIPNDFYDEGLVLSLVYIMVIIFLTVVLGFCTFNNAKNHRESRWILGIAVLSIPTWVVWCAWSILGAVKTRDAAVAIGLLINATILLLLGPIRKLYLLNKYQALIDEQDRQNLREPPSFRGSDYGGVYEHQYDNAPRFHDSASYHGSTQGGYRHPPSSVGRSIRY